MKQFLLPLAAVLILVAILLLGGAGPRGGDPREAVYLTVRRSDSIPDHARILPNTTDQRLMEFTVTNSNATTTYRLENFVFLYGPQNTHPDGYVKYIRAVDGAGTRMLELPILASLSSSASSTPPYALPPLSSRMFRVHGNVYTSISTSTALQIEISNISAADAATGLYEQVYEETSGQPLSASPMRSALFDVY